MRLRYLGTQARNLARNWVVGHSGHLDRALVKPSGIYVDITYQCVMRCRTCFRWKSKPQPHELDLEGWKAVIADLREWLGDFYLNLAGGEPLLRKDLEEIIRFASSLKVRTSVITSGYLLDGSTFDRLSQAGLDCLCLSLDGMQASTHDTIRRRPGSFERVVAAVERHADESRAGRTSTTLSLSTMVMRRNVREIVDLVHWAESRKVHSMHLQQLLPPSAFPFVAKEDIDYESDTAMLDLAELSEQGATDAEIGAVFTELKAMRSSGHFIITNSLRHLDALEEATKGKFDDLKVACRVGHMNFFIDPFGNVRICNLMEPIGSVRSETPRRLWNSPAAQERRCRIRACSAPCRLAHCNFPNVQLGLSLGRLWQHYGRRLSP